MIAKCYYCHKRCTHWIPAHDSFGESVFPNLKDPNTILIVMRKCGHCGKVNILHICPTGEIVAHKYDDAPLNGWRKP